MFTFTKLGRMGRFGNQLFQIAATVGMATRHRDFYVFPTWEHASCFRRPLPQIPGGLYPHFILAQGCFHFREISLGFERSTLIDLHGYFQSERFFLHCADRIRDSFEPNELIAHEIHNEYGRGLSGDSTCIVVVRRGDYEHLPDHHPMQPAAFYLEAMSAFESDTTFFITSDDIDWCRQHLKGDRIIYLPQEKWIHNFFVGTLCQHAIISNTTFGWWIAWLNKHSSPKVIAPKRWFGPLNAHFDTRDLLPDRWSTL